MKKQLQLLSMSGFLLLSSCQKQLEGPVFQNETNSDITPLSIIDPNDPNLNADWNFADPSLTTVQIHYRQREDGQPAHSTQVTLPWFTAGNPVNNEERDYRPELGWVLYLRDFGTPQRPAQTPFFALYNKYSGVLRFFIYNYRVRNLGEASKTYYIAELGFNNISSYNSSLSFYASEDEFVRERINPSTKQIVVTKRDVSDTWLNFDFVMMHDANHSELRLNVVGANQTELNLGSDFSTLTAKASVGASSTSVSAFGAALEKGYAYTGSAQTLFDAIEKLNGELEGNASKLSVSKDLPGETSIGTNSAVGTVAAVVGVVKSVIGVVKSFTGGRKTTSTTQTAIQYSGIVNTTGTATTSNSLYSIQFHQNPAAGLTAHRYVPLYADRVGIMTAPREAYLQVRRVEWPNCYAVGGAIGLVLNASQYRVRTNGTSDFFSIDNIQGLKVDSVSFALVSKQFVDPTKESFLKGMDNPIIGGWRDPSFAMESRRRSDWLTIDSVQTRWKSMTTPVPSYEDDPQYLEIAHLYYPSYPYSDGYLSRPSYTDDSFPYIAIGIYYRITDPNYPNGEGRERVIYKIFAPSDVHFYAYNSEDLSGQTYGCPFWNEHYY